MNQQTKGTINIGKTDLQGLNTINLDKIFIKTQNASRRSLKNLIESGVNNMFKTNLITEEVYRSLGGSKDYSNEGTKESILLLKNDSDVLSKEIICHKCKDNNKKVLTRNLPGFTCDAYLTQTSSKYSVRAKCACCKREKYSYFSFDNFPTHLQETIKKNELIARKKLFK